MNLHKTNFIKKAFYITKEHIVLAQPLVLFLIVLSFTLAGLSTQTNKIAHMIFAFANILLCTAFLAGWFYMIKKGIYLDKRIQNGEYSKPEEKATASFALGKEFFNGVGEYFLKISATTLFYSLLYGVVMFLFFKLGIKILPHIDIDWVKFYQATNSSPMEMQKFVYSLSFEQLKAINIWMFYLGSVVSALTFATMYLYPAIFDTKTNKKEFFLVTPFLAFGRNIMFLFKNFWGSLGIIVFLFVLNTLFSILSIIFNMNIILSIIGLILSFYFMTYAVVLVFLYYEDKKI